MQGFSFPQLRIHVKAALRCGASREEVVETITQLIASRGFPAATNALLTAKGVFDELDAAVVRARRRPRSSDTGRPCG